MRCSSSRAWSVSGGRQGEHGVVGSTASGDHGIAGVESTAPCRQRADTEVKGDFTERPLNLSLLSRIGPRLKENLYFYFETSRVSRILLRGLNVLQKSEKIHVASPTYEEAPQKLVLQNKMFCSIFCS